MSSIGITEPLVTHAATIPLDRLKLLLRVLQRSVISPSEAHPTVQYWKSTDLVREIETIKRAHRAELKTTFPPAREVLRHLEEIGWIQVVPLETPPERPASPTVYKIDMEAGPADTADPLEVLQACQPDGVLCYFGVVAFHELTTQTAPFFHIARLVDAPPVRVKPALEKQAEPLPERNPLGQELFRYQGASGYLTKRRRSDVVGVQRRVIGSRTSLRMTTLEQTLLDTMRYPRHCGGESVVFEAWERAVDRWDVDRLADHLAQLNQPEADRRVGAMLDLLDMPGGSTKLQARLDIVREALEKSNVMPPEIPVLADHEYPRVHPIWRVRLP
jgi:hypothetical protein